MISDFAQQSISISLKENHNIHLSVHNSQFRLQMYTNNVFIAKKY